MTATPEQRQRERLDEEERLLVETFPNAGLDRESRTVVLRNHPLPAGWSHESSDVMFTFPANYPAGKPDNVCARPDLTLASGQLPGNNQGIVTYAGRRWLQMSWHLHGGWSPTSDPAVGDNLTTYLIGALARFEEGS